MSYFHDDEAYAFYAEHIATNIILQLPHSTWQEWRDSAHKNLARCLDALTEVAAGNSRTPVIRETDKYMPLVSQDLVFGTEVAVLDKWPILDSNLPYQTAMESLLHTGFLINQLCLFGMAIEQGRELPNSPKTKTLNIEGAKKITALWMSARTILKFGRPRPETAMRLLKPYVAEKGGLSENTADVLKLVMDIDASPNSPVSSTRMTELIEKLGP